MYSIDFPRMFSGVKTLLLEDHDATRSNLELLLQSDKFALFGDPYYGMILKRVLYEQNSTVLVDLLIDEIYNCIILFMPQIQLTRKDITIQRKEHQLFVTINCINLIDYTPTTYNIQLLNEINFE